MRLPANHDEIAGEVAQQNVILDLRVLCGTSHAEAHVPVRGSVKHVPCGLNGRLFDAHVTAAVFSGATVDMPEVLLRTRAKAAAGGEHNRDEKGLPSSCSAIAEILAHRRRSRSRARRMLKTASGPAKTPDPEIEAWVMATRVISSTIRLCVLRSK